MSPEEKKKERTYARSKCEINLLGVFLVDRLDIAK